MILHPDYHLFSGHVHTRSYKHEAYCKYNLIPYSHHPNNYMVSISHTQRKEEKGSPELCTYATTVYAEASGRMDAVIFCKNKG